MSQQQSQVEEESQLNQLLSNNQNQDPQHIKKNLQLPAQMCEQGRKLLKQQKYMQASKSLSKSIMAFEYILKNNLLQKQKIRDMFKQVIIPVYSNLSLCHLKMGLYESVVACCNQILSNDSSHAKARYRRGQAYQNLKKFEQAIQDFTYVAKIDPQIQQVCQQLIKQCKIGINKQKQKKWANAAINSISDKRSTQSEQKKQIKEEILEKSKQNIFKKAINFICQLCQKSKLKKQE